MEGQQGWRLSVTERDGTATRIEFKASEIVYLLSELLTALRSNSWMELRLVNDVAPSVDVPAVPTQQEFRELRKQVAPAPEQQQRKPYNRTEPFEDTTPFPFGKHRGTAVRDVPLKYLEWLFSRPDAIAQNEKLWDWAVCKYPELVDLEQEDPF